MTHAQKRRTSTGRPLIIGLVVLLVLAAAGFWFLTQGPGRQLLSPAGSVVAEFNGDSNQTTSSFDVREGWAIHWESTGEAFAFAIKGDRDFGTVIDVDESGTGVTSPTGSGTHHLEVVADGPWIITIMQGN